MLKNQYELLPDLKALHLTVIAQSPSPEFLRGHTLALLAVAQQWDVAGEFLAYVRQLDRICQSSLDNQPFILLERIEQR